MLMYESFAYGLMHDILKETRQDIPFPKWKTMCERRNNYIINENQGFVFIEATNEIGYYVKKEFWGKGLAESALKDLFDVNPRKYYYAKMPITNKNSIRVMEKLLFKKTGYVYSKESNTK